MDEYYFLQEKLGNAKQQKLNANKDMKYYTNQIIEYGIKRYTKSKRLEIIDKAIKEGYPEYYINDLKDTDQKWEKGEVTPKAIGRFHDLDNKFNTNLKEGKETFIEKWHRIIYGGGY